MNFNGILFVIYLSFLCVLPFNYAKYNVDMALYILGIVGMTFSTLKSYYVEQSWYFMYHHVLFHAGLLCSIYDKVIYTLPICMSVMAYCFMRISKRLIPIYMWKQLYAIIELGCSLSLIHQIIVSQYVPLSVFLMLSSQIDSFESISKFEGVQWINMYVSKIKNKTICMLFNYILLSIALVLIMKYVELCGVLIFSYGLQSILYHNTEYLSYSLGIVFTYIIFTCCNIYVLYIYILSVILSDITLECIHGTLLLSYSLYSMYSYIVGGHI